MKDLNDAHKAGVDVNELVDSSKAMVPLLGASLGRMTEDGIALLRELVRKVLIAQDKDERVKLLSDAMAKEETRRSLGSALYRKESEFLSLFAQMSEIRGMGEPVKQRLRALQVEAKTVQEQEEQRKAHAYGKAIAGLPPGSGCDGLQAPPGWIVDRNGVSNLAGNIVSYVPILLTHTYRNVETGIARCRIAWLEGETWFHAEVDRVPLLNPRKVGDLLSNLAVKIDTTACNLLVKYFSALEVANKMSTTPAVARMGWVSDCTFVIGTEAIGDPVAISAEQEDMTIVRRFRTGGSWEGWCNAVRKYCISRPHVMFLIYAAVASPLLRILDRPGFIVDESGDTSRGKTTALRAAASVWGPTGAEDGCWFKWKAAGSTGPTRRAWVLNSLPYMVDDTKEGKPEVIRELLFTFPSGQSSTRAKVDGSLQRQLSWRSIMISTGEAPITSFGKDGGAGARCIVMTGAPFGAESVANAQAAMDMTEEMVEHFGHLGRKFVEALIEDRDGWARIRSSFDAKLEELSKGATSAIHRRLLENLAVIAVAADIATKLGMPGEPANVISFAAEQIKRSIPNSDQPRVAMDAVWGWVNANPTRFRTDENKGLVPPGGWLGVVGAGEYAFFPAVIDQYLTSLGHDSSSVRAAWRAREWCRTEKDGSNPKFGTDRCRMVVVKLDALLGNTAPDTAAA